MDIAEFAVKESRTSTCNIQGNLSFIRSWLVVEYHLELDLTTIAVIFKTVTYHGQNHLKQTKDPLYYVYHILDIFQDLYG